MVIDNFQALRRRARELGRKRVAVAMGDDDLVLAAMAQAAALGIAQPILIGGAKLMRAKLAKLDPALIAETIFLEAADAVSAAAMAAALCRTGDADLLLKGRVRTDQLLHAVLDRQHGIQTGRLLSDVLLYEDTLAGARRLVGVTDGGLNVLPSLEQKKQIIGNGIAVMQALGLQRPRVALLSATEAVSEAVPSTLEAKTLTAMAARGEFGECELFGPLALDNALLESAARAKGLASPVAGRADLLVVPNIEAGNILGKAVKYFGGSPCAHVILGAKVPVLIPSRVENAEDKLNSVALGVIVHDACGGL